LQVGESHNGYLDIYVELGIIGIVLLAIFFLAYCRRVRKAFDRNFDWSVLAVCFLLLTLLYNLSESAFLTNGFLWTTMIFLVIVFSSAEAPAAQLASQAREARVLGPIRRLQGRSPQVQRKKRARESRLATRFRLH
jgi:O-antigen ligase